MNISCVICSDLFVSADSIFTTPCGHIFHHACLIQWMERSKSCPQCRNKCTDRNIFRVYFNNVANLDSTTNTASLLESVDNMTLQIREKDQALKEAKDQRLKLEATLLEKQKKIEKLDTSVSRNNTIIATMRHEMDLLSSSRASLKVKEAENAELKSKLDLMVTIETVLSASQKEVDEILKQSLSVRELSVMVGTLRRELNNNETRRNELRKQMQTIKNDLRAEQEERKQLQDKLSFFESENHSLKNRVKRLERHESEADVAEACDVDSPEPSKRPRLALKHLHETNTPSPLTQEEFKSRVQGIQESDSPYLKVSKSSIALASVLKRPLLMKESSKVGSKTRPNDFSQLSIFKKPRILASGSTPCLKASNVTYNGIGGTEKILQSDLKSTWPKPQQPHIVIKKKLSPSALKQ